MGMFVGMLIGLVWSLVISEPRYAKVSRKHNGHPPAEARLPDSIIGGIALVVGLAWCKPISLNAPRAVFQTDTYQSASEVAGSCGPETPWIVCIIG